ncbi:hypothetical protein T484DRAFT_1886438, partial [Baffinella frigidus]
MAKIDGGPTEALHEASSARAREQASYDQQLLSKSEELRSHATEQDRLRNKAGEGEKAHAELRDAGTRLERQVASLAKQSEEDQRLERQVASLAKQSEEDQVAMGEGRRKVADLEGQIAALDRDATRRAETVRVEAAAMQAMFDEKADRLALELEKVEGERASFMARAEEAAVLEKHLAEIESMDGEREEALRGQMGKMEAMLGSAQEQMTSGSERLERKEREIAQLAEKNAGLVREVAEWKA